ncbi:hypothetical protein DFH07DRAFT_334862 [Mycena maculata]|uniref:C2H2-type domain-containing protein n=1 Tax=Mycena maculata TaxID=230809 RepID=A0AAD7MHX1_9AGAR|nr:hypothetical protein DFH07DRAFT_334862 [Mycena maculata]
MLPRKGGDHGATCEICGLYLRRNTDLPRHMLTHSKDKHSMMYTCPMDNCGHRTLQKSNLATHIRTHTRAKPHKCPEYHANGAKCDFSTADPSSLHRHRKRKHGYTPRPKPLPTRKHASYSTYKASVNGRDSDADAEGEPASDYESEESFGGRAEGSEGAPRTTRARVPAEREKGANASVSASADAPVVPTATTTTDVDLDADADADADLDAEGELDPDQDGEGEPEDETEPVLLSTPPLHMENISAERTEQPPPFDCPMPPAPSPPVLPLDPPVSVLSNISDTRTDVESMSGNLPQIAAQ